MPPFFIWPRPLVVGAFFITEMQTKMQTNFQKCLYLAYFCLIVRGFKSLLLRIYRNQLKRLVSSLFS